MASFKGISHRNNHKLLPPKFISKPINVLPRLQEVDFDSVKPVGRVSSTSQSVNTPQQHQVSNTLFPTGPTAAPGTKPKTGVNQSIIVMLML